METFVFPESFVASDLKIGRCRQFTVLTKCMCVFKVMLTFYIDQHDLAKGHLSKAKSQVKDIRNIGPLVWLCVASCNECVKE